MRFRRPCVVTLDQQEMILTEPLKSIVELTKLSNINEGILAI